MKALITVTDKHGTKTRCDSRCYNAITPQCLCCCGGMNHGVGREGAIKNTFRMTEEQIKNFCLQGGLGTVDVKNPMTFRQAKLL